MARWMRRASTVVVVAVAMVSLTAVTAAAAPKSAPSFGVTDPLRNNPNTAFGPFTGSCPWPDFIDQFLPEVQKCLPSVIPWTTDGVRVVSDPMVGPNSETGEFTFWCQSRVGLRFIVTVRGLTPNTIYPITADGYGTIGSLRTDPAGRGVTGGVVRLPKGDYEWVVWVGATLRSAPDDDIGFEVL